MSHTVAEPTTQQSPEPATGTGPGDSALLAAVPTVVLLGLLLMRCALIFVGDGAAYAVARALHLSPAWPTAVAASDLHVVAIDVITLLTLGLLLRRDGRSLRGVLGRFRAGEVPRGLLAFVIVLPAFVVATYLGNLAVYHGAPPATATGLATPSLPFALWTLTVMPVTVAFAEELLYRGTLQPAFAARIGRWPALVLVALGFGLQHAGLSALSVDAVVARVITTFLAGLVFGLLRRRFRTLWPLVIAHWLIDALFLGVPMVLAATGRM
ncbi:hypothetical protein FHX74_000308 [Friedmanniella endophytica]|uniref:CAAX prenyl protease 2/Lysostaphin resistance protein A-like domain-containing protein n=1 Tax=Microlunatus kandeliicorticis TaxID=1759536 RepID=A0A7W3IP81_9ACTN|nr:CPBP family intramembrane glutamic endopeptidase [Microlunatus kandeliicorticis]MBA8792714.1 hypothetical protein [Microlunatus kandeliicorticis]